MKEYNKVLKINKLANVVGCLKKVEAKKNRIIFIINSFYNNNTKPHKPFNYSMENIK